MGKMRNILNADAPTVEEVTTTPSSSDDLAREFASDWSAEPAVVEHERQHALHNNNGNKAGDYAINWPEAGAEAAQVVEEEVVNTTTPERFSTLADKAFLATLTMTAYSSDVTDKSASAELAIAKHASEKAVTVKKDLLPNCSALKEIKNLCASIRKEHIALSMAWADRGARLIPNVDHAFTYWEFARRATSAHDEAKVKLDSQYDWALQRTHIELGDLYDPTIYLPKQEVLDKFSISFDYSDVPTGDLRVVDHNEEINEEMTKLIDEAKATTRSEHARLLSKVGTKAWADLLDPLCNMIWQLREENHDGTTYGFKGKYGDEPVKPSYKNTLVDNVIREIDLLDAWFLQTAKGLDPSMDEATSRIVRLASNFRNASVDAMKEELPLRHSTRDYALKILSEVPKEAKAASLQKTLKQKQTGAAVERVQVLNLVQ